eukprot:scaffold314131_cov37-Prasinocladus_malaysianus.AAC.1
MRDESDGCVLEVERLIRVEGFHNSRLTERRGGEVGGPPVGRGGPTADPHGPRAGRDRVRAEERQVDASVAHRSDPPGPVEGLSAHLGLHHAAVKPEVPAGPDQHRPVGTAKQRVGRLRGAVGAQPQLGVRTLGHRHQLAASRVEWELSEGFGLETYAHRAGPHGGEA